MKVIVSREMLVEGLVDRLKSVGLEISTNANGEPVLANRPEQLNLISKEKDIEPWVTRETQQVGL